VPVLSRQVVFTVSGGVQLRNMLPRQDSAAQTNIAGVRQWNIRTKTSH